MKSVKHTHVTDTTFNNGTPASEPVSESPIFSSENKSPISSNSKQSSFSSAHTGAASSNGTTVASRKRPRSGGGGGFNGTENWLIHPPDGSKPIDLRQEAESIYSAFQRSICRDIVFELHRELHTGVLTTERLWAERLHPPPKPKPGGDVYGRVPPKEPSSNITCPSCNRAVGAARYAPHLDKCALGSSRGRPSRARGSPTPANPFKSLDSAGPSYKASSSKPSTHSRPSSSQSANSRSSSAKPSKSSSATAATISSSSNSKPTPASSSSSVCKPPTAKGGSASKPAAGSSSGSGNSKASGNAKTSGSAKASGSRNSNNKAKASSIKSGEAVSASGSGFRYTRAPPPPLPTPSPPDKKKETLHILIKVVDGAPVQTYHRVLLTAPKGEKGPAQPLELPQSPPPRSSSFSRSNSFTEDHRGGSGGPRSPPPSPRLSALSNPNSGKSGVGGSSIAGTLSPRGARGGVSAVSGRGVGSEGNATHDATSSTSSAYKDRRFVDARGLGGVNSNRGGLSRTSSASSASDAEFLLHPQQSSSPSPRGSTSRHSRNAAPAPPPPPPSPTISARRRSSSADATSPRILPMLISASGSSPRSASSVQQQHSQRANGAGSPTGSGQDGPGSLGRKDGSRHSVMA